MFKCLVELLGYDQWRVHLSVDASVDALLAGRQPHTQLRMRQNGKMVACLEAAPADPVVSDSKVADTEPSWLTSLGKLAT